MAESSVSFDILLGGKISPEVIKMLNETEARLKKLGASTKTQSEVMRRAYNEAFGAVGKSGKEAFDKVEKSSKEAFKHMTEQAKEASKKMSESFDRVKESYKKLGETVKKGLEFVGLGGVLTAVGGAVTIEELFKRGIEVHTARATRESVLMATLRGRGREDLFEGYKGMAERLSGSANIGDPLAGEIVQKLAASGKFAGPEQAERIARSLINLGGGTTAGAAESLGTYESILAGGKISPKTMKGLAAGSGFGGALLQQISRDTGIPIASLGAAFGTKAPKLSSKGELVGDPYGAALSGSKGLRALNAAIIELGEGKAAAMAAAHMQGMEGLFYRLNNDWENFLNKFGEIFENVISPIANEINAWLDSINFEETFRNMIEVSKEWGQEVKAVWAILINTPAIKTLQSMFENLWRAMLGGHDMYGPVVAIWDDASHKAFHWGRHMTEAGHKFVENTAKTIENIITPIIDAFKWFVDHPKEVSDTIWNIVKALIVLKGIEISLTLINFLTSLANLGGLAFTGLAGLAEASGLAALLIPIIPEILLAGVVVAAIAAVIWRLPGFNEPKRNLQANMAQKRADIERERANELGLLPAPDTPAKVLADEAARKDINERYDAQLKALDEETKQREKAIEAEKDQKKALDLATMSTKKFNDMVEKTTGNDLTHLNLAIDKSTTGFLNFSLAMQSATAGMQFGLGSGYGGGGGMTEYGASVPGDQPGGPTYDWNSYHGIGAYTQHLVPGQDVAMHPAYAMSHYHIRPLDFYISDKDHLRHRWADKTGSKMFDNEDLYRGATGGIITRATRALLGESGPEAVVPLSRAPGASSLPGGHTFNFNISLGAGAAAGESFIREMAETIAREVRRVLDMADRRSAVV